MYLCRTFGQDKVLSPIQREPLNSDARGPQNARSNIENKHSDYSYSMNYQYSISNSTELLFLFTVLVLLYQFNTCTR